MRDTHQPCLAPDGGSGGPPHDRFGGIRRDHTPDDMERLAGSFVPLAPSGVAVGDT